MIISETPMRMSFVGGGSDLPLFYRKYGGAVVSTAIDKYVYIAVNKRFDDSIRVSYSKTEEVSVSREIQHPLLRNCLEYLNIDGGVEITSISDIPSKGAGLGSSSAFTAGLLHVLKAYKGEYIDKEDLAEQACHIELNLCKDPIGKQDQYASAYGGFNYIRFNEDESVDVEPIICKTSALKRVKDSLIVFYTGIVRSASEKLREQGKVIYQDIKKQNTLRSMVGLAETLYKELCDNNTDAFGGILHENWLLKRSISDNISSTQIDDWYNKAMRNGAIGGKLMGAGGGGFLVFYAHPENHEKIKHALSNLRCMKFNFASKGSSIIFYHKKEG